MNRKPYAIIEKYLVTFPKARDGPDLVTLGDMEPLRLLFRQQGLPAAIAKATLLEGDVAGLERLTLYVADMEVHLTSHNTLNGTYGVALELQSPNPIPDTMKEKIKGIVMAKYQEKIDAFAASFRNVRNASGIMDR